MIKILKQYEYWGPQDKITLTKWFPIHIVETLNEAKSFIKGCPKTIDKLKQFYKIEEK